jgi:hypothetical protein
MNWLTTGRSPDAAEGQQIARLMAALLAVLFSWEGYFSSIANKKLTSPSRFYIDFILVLLYMVLLYTSKIPTWWIYIHTLSFTLYVVCDVFTIRDYSSLYSRESPSTQGVSAIYVGCIEGKDGYYRGPSATLLWAIYFVGFSILQYVHGPRNSWALFLFVVAPLYLYRQDKRRAFDDWEKRKASFNATKTFIIVASLWVLLFALFYYYHSPALGTLTKNCTAI